MEKSEYRYFDTFVRNTKVKISNSHTLNLLYLQFVVLELSELLISHKSYKDSIRFKCGEIFSVMFMITQDIPALRPCVKSSRPNNKWDLDKDQSIKLSNLMTKMKLVIYNYIQVMNQPWDRNSFEALQLEVDEFTLIVWEISNTMTIHDLLSLTIQINSKKQLLHQKSQIISYKPYMANAYEIKSIYPWKYTWNHYSMEFWEYLNQCGTIKMGKEYSIEELLDILKEIICHKLVEHELSEETITLELSFYLNTPTSELNINDVRTLIYPLLYHLNIKSYEEIWMEKHKNSWRNTKELKNIAIQENKIIKYPPCPLKENYSVPQEKENNVPIVQEDSTNS
jgi:hypothetical protein